MKHLEANQWLPSEQIKSIQWEKLTALLKHAESNVPYYGRVLQKLGTGAESIESFEDFRSLPLLHKRNIRENIDKIIAYSFDRRSLIRQTTSGSTGEPVTILWDNQADIIASASGLRFRRWAGHDIGEKHARIWGQTLNPAEAPAHDYSLRNRFNRMLSHFMEPSITLNSYDTMTETLMKGLQTKLKPGRLTCWWAT